MKQGRTKGVQSRNLNKASTATAKAPENDGRATPKILTNMKNSPSKTEAAAMNESHNASSIQNSSLNNSAMITEKIPRARVAIREYLGKAMLQKPPPTHSKAAMSMAGLGTEKLKTLSMRASEENTS